MGMIPLREKRHAQYIMDVSLNSRVTRILHILYVNLYVDMGYADGKLKRYGDAEVVWNPLN